jgi:hypothetical protein
MASSHKNHSNVAGRPARRRFLAGVAITLVGVGSLARPLAELAVRHGATDFTLIDMKAYKPASVRNQCEPHEVGQLKAVAVARRLSRLGANVRTYAEDVFQVPDGVVAAGGIVVSSVDNWRGFIGANRLAMRIGARLLKLNVEPQFHCAAARCYWLGPGTSLCGEDQMDDRHYRDQLHPRSCDAATRQRPTASPRDLCEHAARLGLVALYWMETRDSQYWHGRQWQYLQDSGRLLTSQLVPNPSCRCDHAAGWQHLGTPLGLPSPLSLRTIFQRSDVPMTGASRVRFCRRVALRTRCTACLHEGRQPYWVNDVDWAGPTCPKCGGATSAVPFWTYQEVTCDQLASVIHLPLRQWGVPPLAVIEVSHQQRRRAIVVPDQPSASQKGAAP